MNDLVSVIIPVYKTEKYLRESLNSVINQTYRNIEIILVDDGSPDNCPKICDEYAEMDNRLKVIHKKNAGVSDARNRGLDVAIGEYITFVDSDDIVNEYYVEKLYKTLVETDAEISICQVLCSEEKNKIDEMFVLSGKDAVKDLYKRSCGIKSDYFLGIPMAVWGKLFKKDYFRNIRFPFGKIHEDVAVLPLLLYKSKRVCVIAKGLYYYRHRDGSIMTTSFSVKNYDAVDAVEFCASFFLKRGEKDLYKLALLRKKILLSYFSLKAQRKGIYASVPKKFHINFLMVIYYLKKYGRISWKELVAIVFPQLYKKFLSIKTELFSSVQSILF